MNHPRLYYFIISTIVLLGIASITPAHAAKRRARQKQDQDVDAIGHQPTALENTFKLCQDGEDNDSDNYVDCQDQDCWLFAICAESRETENETTAEPSPLDQEVPPALGGEEEVVVDLDSLEEEESAPSPAEEAGGAGGHHGHGGGDFKPPKFKLFFDFITEYEFETKNFQFTRDHAHVMLELTAADWLTFRGDIAFEPEFYEVVFQIKSVAEFRVGKVLVPFGQNEFHHLIGGRVDKESLFLPTVWGEYGFAFKHFVFDGDVVAFDYALWVINGFKETTGANGNPEPSRSDGGFTDNNKMKGVGLRPALHIGRSVTLGTSWYFDAWDSKSENYMLIYGVDLELGYDLIPVPVLRNLRIRAEAAWADIRMPTGRNPYHGIFAGELNGILPNYGIRRSGYNIEVSYRILNWLFFRYREGLLNDDSRITNKNDLLIHEPGILAIFGPVQLSLMGQIHTMLASDKELEAAGTPDEPNHSQLILRMLFRY